MDLSRSHILSRPCEVVWAGFRSNTYLLQQKGWEIAAQEEPAFGRASLILRHRDMRLYAICAETEFDFMRNARSGFQQALPVFEVIHVANNIEVFRIDTSVSSFHQIDAAPQFVNTELKSIDDFKIFATPLVRTEELIVEPADVSALLEKIKSMQSPEQKNIRERNRRRENDTRPSQVFHAQIISLSDRKEAA